MKRKKKSCPHDSTTEISYGYKPYWFYQKCLYCHKVIGQWKDFTDWMKIWGKP